ncbi:hypothetical protein VE03_04961 [Pseudogymnoascus sp. 23342-1-I1]|nr:hypothetical protein VE03_04961 [Pseudogymnoascus sp. 23342-1-I1]
MVTYPHFLLLSLYLLSPVSANDDPTSDSLLEWLVPERSVLIHLPTPDLPFLINSETPSLSPSALLFNLTLAPDNLTLLLNGSPILPRAHPHIPTPIRAYQTVEHTNVTSATPLDLDYYLDSPDATSATSIYNTHYNPRIRLDILRARTPLSSFPLPSPSQRLIWVWLEDLSPHPPGTLYSAIPLRIKLVQANTRWLNTGGSGGTTTYRSLESLGGCYGWSWLCGDVDAYPYYKYVYQELFDGYGKRGSMRHFVTSVWGALVGVLGKGAAGVFLVVGGGVMFAPAGYGVWLGVMGVVGRYRRRVKEVDEWVADEEVEGLLRYDTYLEDEGEIEEEVLRRKEVEKQVLRKPSLPILTAR